MTNAAYKVQDGTISAYDGGAVLLHWLIAGLIFVELGLGFVMRRLDIITEAGRFSMMQWHKSFGLLVLILTVVRIFWRLANKPPKHTPMAAIELLTARIVSFLFYALMLLVPLTGWLLVSVSSTQIATFFFTVSGLIWPHLPIEPDEIIEMIAAGSHMILAYSFLLLLFLHIGGALKHVFIDHVPEIARIVPHSKLPKKPSSPASRHAACYLFIGLMIGGLGIGQIPRLTRDMTLSATTQTPADNVVTNIQESGLENSQSEMQGNWLIDTKNSTFGFTLAFSGNENQGEIGSWQTIIQFDPDALNDSYARILLDSTSISSEDAYIAGSIAGKDGLDTENYPQIEVILDQFAKSATAYQAQGRVTIKEITLPVTVDFTYSETNGRARVSGHTTLDRLAFDIGRSNDPDAAWLDRMINVHFYLEATRL